MKKLHLNKIFHWLYAFLMFYPILCFFGTIVFNAFNASVNVDTNIAFDDEVITILSLHCLNLNSFTQGSIGYSIVNSIYGVVTSFGFYIDDITFMGTAFGSLFIHWIIVSVFYLLFDVIMYPINLFHRWIDEGGI